MRWLAVIISVCAVTPAVGEVTKLAGLLNPNGAPVPTSSIRKVGECFTTCNGGGARNDCAAGQTCTCYCDGSGRAVCEICR